VPLLNSTSCGSQNPNTVLFLAHQEPGIASILRQIYRRSEHGGQAAGSRGTHVDRIQTLRSSEYQTWGPHGKGLRGVKTMVQSVGDHQITPLESYVGR
jgi:hypothetical protein